MLKNKISLHVFVAINFVALGLFSLALSYTLYKIFMEDRAPSSLHEDKILGIIIPTISGALFLFSGLGLFLRMKWARISVNFILFIAFILTLGGGGIMALSAFPLSRHALFASLPVLSILLFSFCTQLCIFFFINNTKVLEILQSPKQPSPDRTPSSDANQ